MYPATSGKEQAARYLIQQLGADTANCSLLCDDDNDLSALLFPPTLISPIAGGTMNDAYVLHCILCA